MKFNEFNNGDNTMKMSDKNKHLLTLSGDKFDADSNVGLYLDYSSIEGCFRLQEEVCTSMLSQKSC